MRPLASYTETDRLLRMPFLPHNRSNIDCDESRADYAGCVRHARWRPLG
jgi:hypothetical protein